MMDDDFYVELPQDDAVAFLMIEREERRLLHETGSGPDGEIYPSWQFEYMNKVQTAAETLCIEPLASFRMLRPRDDGFQENFETFQTEVDRTIVRLRLDGSGPRRRYSVELDQEAKSKIHDLIGKIRQVIQAADLDQEKKNALFGRLADLEVEVDRSRTRYSVVLLNILAFANTGGEAAKRLAPWMRFIEGILEAIGIAKAKEEASGLPAPRERRRLEAPKKKPEAFELDEKIPF